MILGHEHNHLIFYVDAVHNINALLVLLKCHKMNLKISACRKSSGVIARNYNFKVRQHVCFRMKVGNNLQ
jgi:hypothetical protein